MGVLVSLIIVPFAMNMMYSGNSTLGVKVSFSPIIFIGAAIFTLLTAVIGSMKPAKIAGSISPIAASQYNAVSVKNMKKRKAHRLRLSRMALSNIFRNPKSAVLTFTSLFLGLMLFLIASGLLSSLSAENFVSQWGESDFAVTYSIQEEENLITDEMLKEIEAIDGIENMRVTYSASPQTTIPVIYNQDVFGKYIDSLNGVSGLNFSDAETLKNYTDNFFGSVYGIDTEYVKEVNSSLETPIDLNAFENGDVVLLSAMTDEDGNPLIQPGQSITVIGETGKHTFTVASGFLDADFQSGRGNERGTAPDLYISQQALKMLSPEVKIFRIAFDTINSKNDERILSELQTITASSGIDIQSRYERGKEIESYLFTSRVLAMGLSSVLLLIGIMNFINTMFVSVNTRKHEFATLESIGMTKRQLRQVLLFEGGYYWIISFLLLATLGTGIYLPLYAAFRQVASYAAFNYPIIPLVIAAFIILAICLAVPILTFRMDIKASVTERLQQS